MLRIFKKEMYFFKFKRMYVAYLLLGNNLPLFTVVLYCFTKTLKKKISTNFFKFLAIHVLFYKKYITVCIVSIKYQIGKTHTIVLYKKHTNTEKVTIKYVFNTITYNIISNFYIDNLQTTKNVNCQKHIDNAQLSYKNGELEKLEIFFLRKNRVFNKGRYSRNRQNYRTGVYICFYLSIVSIFGLYYTFYKFSFNLSYLWFFFLFFVGGFFLNKLLKYNLWSFFSVNLLVKKFIK